MNVCVGGATLSINLSGSLASITPNSGSISGGGQTKIYVKNDKPVLVEEDIKNWIGKFKASYATTGGHIDGVLKGESATLKDLATRSYLFDKELILQSTVLELKFSVETPAKLQGSPPVLDTTRTYTVTAEFTNAGQTIWTSL